MTDITDICYLRKKDPDGEDIDIAGSHAASIDDPTYTSNNPMTDATYKPQEYVTDNSFGKATYNTGTLSWDTVTPVVTSFWGSTNLNGNVLDVIQPPTSITFDDDESVTHTLKFQDEDVTATQHALAVNFQLEIGGLKTYGSILATYDGTNWHGHPTLYGVQHEHINYTFSTVGDKVQLHLAGSGSGDAATFKYAISKPFGTL